MSRRRRLCLISLAVAFLMSLAAGVVCWKFPALNAVEWRLVGKWATPEFGPGIGYVTKAGPVANPWRVWEFRRDRTFRVRIVSADDPSVNLPDVEGHWRVVDGKLRLDGLGRAESTIREVQDRVEYWLGRPVPRRITGDGAEHSFTFPDRETMEIALRNGRRIAWKRRP